VSIQRKYIFQWVEHGLLKGEHVEDALHTSGALPDRADWRIFIERLFLWTGSVLFAVGTIFFIAYNWKELGNFAKFGLAETLIVAAIGCCIWFGTESLVGKAALFTGALFTGALLALFGQTYQTGADTYELFITWAVAILPWTAVSRLPALWILLVSILNIAVTFYFRAFPGVFGMIFNPERQLWVLFALNTVSLMLWEFFSKYVIWLRERWATRFLSFASGGLITSLVVMAIFDHDNNFNSSFIVYPLWLIAIYACYRYFIFDLFVLAGGVLSFIIVVATFLNKAMIHSGSWSGAYLIIGGTIIGLSALGGFWLKTLAQENQQ